MERILHQIIGMDIEELWYFDSVITDDQIEEFWDDYIDRIRPNIFDFEDYMTQIHPEIYCERIFVNEIYVK